MVAVRHNQKQFETQITAMQQELSVKGVAKVIRGKIIRLFERIVVETPQWSGAAASSWTIDGVGKEVPSGWDAEPLPLFSKGMDPAVGAAFSNNAWINSAGEEIMDGVKISNPQDIIGDLEAGHAGKYLLRSVNLPGRMVARAISAESGTERLSWVKAMYENERLG